MMKHKPVILALLFSLLFIDTVGAVTFEKIFFAGAGQNGELGGSRAQFSPDESQIYLRFIYRDGVPGQKLIAHWRIIEDVRGRRGEFAKSEMTLEKSSDKGQFSFRAEEPWTVGRYRVTITDSDNIIVEEMDFQVVNNQQQDNSNLQESVFVEEQEELPPSFLDGYQSNQDKLLISKLFISGRKDSSQFKSSEPTVYVRFEYEGATLNKAVDAIWEHLGDYGGGIGIFARDRLILDDKSGKAQFSFKPKPAGSWLPGKYRVVLLSGQQVIGKAQFSIEASGKRIDRYNDVVNLVSRQVDAQPKIIDSLYRQRPALFSPIEETLALVKEIELYANQPLESLSRNINWSRSKPSNSELRELDEALRNYRVSAELLPKGVKTTRLPEGLVNIYGNLRKHLSASHAYTEALAQTDDFTGHKTLHLKLLNAKGESPQTVTQELNLYLNGKANLYWMNRLEAHFLLNQLKSQKEMLIESLWRQRGEDFNLIKEKITK